MGDRVSVSFRNGSEESVALFDHGGGVDFAKRALAFARELGARGAGSSFPLGRLEPGTVMVNFVHVAARELISAESSSKYVECSLYLGRDGHDGDNCDNGHFTIDLESMSMEGWYK